MVSATRPTSWRTPVSRAPNSPWGVPMWPWRYLEATMLVAVIDQSAGTSTSFCSKIDPPGASGREAGRPSPAPSLEAGGAHAGGLGLRHRLAVVGGPAVLSGGRYGISGLGHRSPHLF